MSVDTMARLFELKNIIGVKDATANLDRVDEQKRKIGNDFIQLSGEDGTALEFNLRGGRGVHFSDRKYCAQTLFRISRSIFGKK